MPTARPKSRRRSSTSAANHFTPLPTYAPSPTSTSPYSFSNLVRFLANNFSIIFMVGLFFIVGFFAGSLWTENQMLRSGKGVATAPTQPTAQAPQPSGPTPDQLKKAPKVTDADFSRGNKNAKVTLIEYSDFECPFCARFHPTMLQVMKEYGDKVNWVYRHFPLSFHPHAQKAAEASECIAKQKGQDAFWKYADAIFEENTKAGGQLSDEIIQRVAESTGVNMTAFKSCLDSGEMKNKVTQIAAGGTQAGISGTPGTIILTNDGKADLIPGALTFDQVKAILDQYVK